MRNTTKTATEKQVSFIVNVATVLMTAGLIAYAYKASVIFFANTLIP